jgi:hypothetical protein
MLYLSAAFAFLLCLYPEDTRLEQRSEGALVFSSSQDASVWQQGPFRIIFHSRGEHAVPPEDGNANGVPDVVEDMATQLNVAHHIFCDISGFRDPLKAARNKGVSYIDVYIYSRAKLNGANGAAFQWAGRAHKPAAKGVSALRIHLP